MAADLRVYACDFKTYDEKVAENERVQVEPEDPRGAVFGSLGADGLHTPQLDLDVAHVYTPSSTEGHGHLTLTGLNLTWKEYKRLLKALRRAGVIQDGYYYYSMMRGQTFLRLPHVKKEVPNA